MSTPPPRTAPPIEQWVPLFQQEGDFAAAIKEGEVRRVPEPGDLQSGEHAIRCQRCQNVLVLEPCRHCGGTRYTLRRTAYDQVALYCKTCTRVYDRTACSCGTIVPLGQKVLLKKVLVQPVPARTILRWTAIAVACIIVLILVLNAW